MAARPERPPGVLRSPEVAAAFVGGVFLTLATVITVFAAKGGCKPSPTTAPTEDKVLLVGSGTVYDYLVAHCRELFSEKQSPRIHPLQGGSEVGIQLLGTAYQHFPEPWPFPIVAMSADSLPRKMQFVTTGQHFIALSLDLAPVEVTIGTDKDLTTAFPQLKAAILSNQRNLTVRTLAGLVMGTNGWSSGPRGYSVYAPTSGSGTRKCVERALRDVGLLNAWPMDEKAWDLNVVTLPETGAWIAIGNPSDELTVAQYEKQGKWHRFTLTQSDGRRIERELGFVLECTQKPNSDTLYVDKRTSGFLYELSMRLSEPNSGVSDEVSTRVSAQLLWLHIRSKSDEGWIAMPPRSQGNVHRMPG